MLKSLNIIEKYDSKENAWTILETLLPEQLSNNAAVSLNTEIEEFSGKILLLGGGT